MEKQRYLRCPPEKNSSNKLDLIPKLHGYKYPQRIFKSFTDEEIRNQVGKEALLAVNKEQGDKAYSSDPEQHSEIPLPGLPSRRDPSQQHNNPEAGRHSTTRSPSQSLLQTPVHPPLQFLPQTPERGSPSPVLPHSELETLRPPPSSLDRSSPQNSPLMDIDMLLVDMLSSRGSRTQKRERAPSLSTAMTPPQKASRLYEPNGEQISSIPPLGNPILTQTH